MPVQYERIARPEGARPETDGRLFATDEKYYLLNPSTLSKKIKIALADLKYKALLYRG